MVGVDTKFSVRFNAQPTAFRLRAACHSVLLNFCLAQSVRTIFYTTLKHALTLTALSITAPALFHLSTSISGAGRFLTKCNSSQKPSGMMAQSGVLVLHPNGNNYYLIDLTADKQKGHML